MSISILQIENRIFTIRGMQVMVDFHLAELYDVQTRRINEQVKRNIQRFPRSFMFQLTASEWENLQSHIATADKKGGLQSQIATAKRRTLPFVFTEQGIDGKEVNHLGASLKDLGKKPVVSIAEPWFAFSKLEAKTVVGIMNEIKGLK